MTITLDESDRQACILALSQLALERPGWMNYLESIAAKMNGAAMFQNFIDIKANAAANALVNGPFVPDPGYPVQ